jgi:lipoprotein-anchoring transpeptidase ErfK/SrfK
MCKRSRRPGEMEKILQQRGALVLAAANADLRERSVRELRAMRHICIPAFLCSLFVVPALADPLQIAPGNPNVSVQPNRGGGLGGGFIEFLVGGGTQRSAALTPPAAQPVYQPSPVALPPPPLQPESLSSLPPLTPAEAATLTPAQAAALGIELPPAPVTRPEPPVRPEAILRPAPAAAPASVETVGHPPVDAKYDRQVVVYSGDEKPGTIIIDTPNKFLYLVQEDGKAMRYGIGVGRPGFTWAGVREISAKREWPDWIPPGDMLHRQPNLPRFVAGGPEDPLGARALYLGSTLYRIHGSNEPWTIGQNVSSGCIRMRNADVEDLYGRVKVGTKVVVM